MRFDAKAFAARGWVVSRGFIDLHAHLREPGFEESETIESGARAALRGGFTTICGMPNTEPPIDSPGAVREMIERGIAANGARVLPVACITRGRKGRELADMVELASSGAVLFSDDGSPVEDGRLFRSALEYSRAADRPISEHAQDLALARHGVMHEGAVSAALGLTGMPAAAEESAIARDVALAKLVGARLHLAHVSTAGAVDLVRRAKAEGAAVTCEVAPHHLALTDEWVAGSRDLAFIEELSQADPTHPLVQSTSGVAYDSNTKVNPPLRTAADVRACWAGLRDGAIDAIATDHAPHASVHKDVELEAAAFGIAGLETAIPLLLAGVAAGLADLDTVLAALTTGPARVLGRELEPDDWVVIDPRREWTVTPASLASKSANTPLLGRTVRGRAVMAVVGGDVRWEDAAETGSRSNEPALR